MGSFVGSVKSLLLILLRKTNTIGNQARCVIFCAESLLYRANDISAFVSAQTGKHLLKPLGRIHMQTHYHHECSLQAKNSLAKNFLQDTHTHPLSFQRKTTAKDINNKDSLSLDIPMTLEYFSLQENTLYLNIPVYKFPKTKTKRGHRIEFEVVQS